MAAAKKKVVDEEIEDRLSRVISRGTGMDTEFMAKRSEMFAKATSSGPGKSDSYPKATKKADR